MFVGDDKHAGAGVPSHWGANIYPEGDGLLTQRSGVTFDALVHFHPLGGFVQLFVQPLLLLPFFGVAHRGEQCSNERGAHASTLLVRKGTAQVPSGTTLLYFDIRVFIVEQTQHSRRGSYDRVVPSTPVKTPVLIGVPCSDTGRFSDFSES